MLGSESGEHHTGANPTIVSYNASDAKIYNAMSSLVHYDNKKIVSSTLKKRFSLLQRWRCSCKFREVVGLASD
jgi:hypothetical protein